MKVHLGDPESYVQEKLERGGYASAAEVIREGLRKMRDQEQEDATLRAIGSTCSGGSIPGHLKAFQATSGSTAWPPPDGGYRASSPRVSNQRTAVNSSTDPRPDPVFARSRSRGAGARPDELPAHGTGRVGPR